MAENCVVIYVWLYMCECNIVQIKNSFQQQFNGSLVDQGIAQCVVICINVVIYVWFYIYMSVTHIYMEWYSCRVGQSLADCVVMCICVVI